jgi:uncharacterized surface protein with fasciclin (FAS1) repeats
MGSVACGDDADESPAGETTQADIVDTAAEAGQFDTLVAAVQAAELEATLRGPGPFTVFAPTDDAFAALPAGTVNTLLLPENKATLQSILTYHVVAGRFTAADVTKLASVTTVEGSSLAVTVSGSEVRIGDAKVIATDVEAENGVIHVIDKVLIPE